DQDHGGTGPYDQFALPSSPPADHQRHGNNREQDVNQGRIIDQPAHRTPRVQAPATVVGGGGSRRSLKASRRARAAGRKNTHAVTIKPNALATAVRRSVLSWANIVKLR